MKTVLMPLRCRQKSAGFTLMEVSVALAFLTFGMLAVGRFLDGFNQLRSVERNQAETLIAAASAIENFVEHSPSCADSAFALSGMLVRRSAVRGVDSLAWILVSTENNGMYLRRLVRCRKN